MNTSQFVNFFLNRKKNYKLFRKNCRIENFKEHLSPECYIHQNQIFIYEIIYFFILILLDVCVVEKIIKPFECIK